MDAFRPRFETLTAVPPQASSVAGPKPASGLASRSVATDNVTASAVIGNIPSTAGLLDTATDPPKTVAEARDRLEAIVLPKVDESSPYGQVERISLHPNQIDFYLPENKGPLEQAIKGNRTLVAAARQKLDASQQANYDQLWKLAADDIGAQAALQMLVLEGTLTTSPSSQNQQSLLTELALLADKNQALAPGLDRKSLICDLMQEIAFPSSISQRHRGTCTVTTAQMFMAIKRPAEYARIVRELATETAAPVTLVGGAQWLREPSTESDDDSFRSQSSRLFQAAAMEALLPDADYDNATDRHYLPTGQPMRGGDTRTLATLVKGLLGPDAYVEPRWCGDCGGAEGMAAAIIEAAQNGHPSLVATYKANSTEAAQGGNGHELLVIGATAEGVRFINPWGQIETMSKAALAEIALGVVFVNAQGTEPPVASLVPPQPIEPTQPVEPAQPPSPPEPSQP